MEQLNELFNGLFWGNLLRACVLGVAGLLVAKICAKFAQHMLETRLSSHALTLTRRGIFWLIFILFLISVFHQLGFKLSVLLGAAGVLSVALGFASQTAASNLISGLFVLSERSFSIGDVIRVGSTTGEVLSVDLLSVKLRTFDNLFVRIPNEQIIKSEVTTLSKYPIRRFDLLIGIAYNADIAAARSALLQVAKDNLLCLEEPKPQIFITGFNNSSVDLQFSVWSTRENFLELKNSMQEQVKLVFDAAGIEIPYPHLSVYAGAATAPFPIEIVTRGQQPCVPPETQSVVGSKFTN